MHSFFNRVFPYLDKFRYRLLHVLIILVFSILFLITFKPFNIVDWLQYPGFLESFGLASVGILLSITIAVSQLLIRTIIRIPSFRILHLGIWLISEILVITLILTIFFGEEDNSFILEYLISLKFTSIGLILPYAFSIMILALIYQNTRTSSVSQARDPENPDLLHIRDEREQVKFSVRRSYILYLESTDNYITIFYMHEGELKKELVRNSMKKMETEWAESGLLRCHRSFMVNVENIEWIKKEGRNYQIRMKKVDTIIPVSRGYVPAVRSLSLK